MNEQVLILAAGLALAYATVSRVASRSIVTPSMVFVGAGLLCSPLGFGLIDIGLDNEGLALLASVALAIIVCADASTVDRNEIHRIRQLPLRLLFVGLPLTMVLGTGIAMLVFPGFELAALALLAVLLSPTDAALGQAVITSEAVPEPIRETLNVESGLNDGIALPPIFVLIALLGADLGDAGSHGWLTFAALQILLGPVAGAAVGLGAGRAIEAAAARHWVDPGFGRLTLPAIALLAYAFAELIGGNGFIAAFISGFTLGVRTPAVREAMTAFGETEGSVLSLIVFLTLGLAMIPGTVEHWSLATTAYAVLSLTIARMLPVALSVIGLRLDAPTILFLGWFGPRGIASILYLLLLVQYLGVDGYEILFATGIQTIALSVLLHGVTAAPLAQRYGRWKSAHAAVGAAVARRRAGRA
ncbi:MAG: cation:proton antiporter [Myxococcota bacterium]|nr:cation:proton antiporter [Myxococcota bacterium]